MAFKAAAKAEQLAITHLAPWPTWKLFKHFTKREIADAYETVSFQFVRIDDDPEGPYFAVFFVWQFTARDSPEEDGSTDEFLGRFVVELRYPAEPCLLLPDTEVWDMDFHNPGEWATVVEGLPQFQEAMSHDPMRTQVYYGREP